MSTPRSMTSATRGVTPDRQALTAEEDALLAELFAGACGPSHLARQIRYGVRGPHRTTVEQAVRHFTDVARAGAFFFGCALVVQSRLGDPTADRSLTELSMAEQSAQGPADVLQIEAGVRRDVGTLRRLLDAIEVHRQALEAFERGIVRALAQQQQPQHPATPRRVA